MLQIHNLKKNSEGSPDAQDELDWFFKDFKNYITVNLITSAASNVGQSKIQKQIRKRASQTIQKKHKGYNQSIIL